MEVTHRWRADGRNVYFLLNHGESSVKVVLPEGIFSSLLNDEEIEGQVEVAALDVVVLFEGGHEKREDI